MPTPYDKSVLLRKSWPNQIHSNRALRIVDLFAGAGGMSLGAYLAAQALGLEFEVALAIENDARVAEIYSHNFHQFSRDRDQSPILVDEGVHEVFDGQLGCGQLTVHEAETVDQCGEIDLLMGGPPCQGHSDLNNHTRRADSRNVLYERMARAAEVLRPRTILIENVPTVIHARCGVVDRAEATLVDLGYATRRTLLSFDRLGVPQRRRRHVLMGALDLSTDTLQELAIDLEHAVVGRGRDVRWAIGDLEKAAGQPGRGGFDDPVAPSVDNATRLDWFQRNPDFFDLPDAYRPTCHRDKPHSYKSIYGRMRWDEPAQTVTTGFGSMGQGRYVHPAGTRTITPHEAARLQTFPDFFRFDSTSKRTVWAKAIGNAVPPLGIRRVVEALMRCVPV